MLQRLRRLRKSPVLREMISETHLSKDMFIYPYFIVKGKNMISPVEAMPGINRFSPDTLLPDVEKGLKAGVNKILLFGAGEDKFEDAHSAHDHHSVVPEAIRLLKKQFGEDLYIITDVCLCAYTTHGHCGIVVNNYVQNDPTVEILAKMALTHVEAGADMVAPSDMMDGRIKGIRELLDKNKFESTPIMSYSTKFASAYYGPFREAAGSAPGKGDRKSYQMDFRNAQEAILEGMLDEKEGADILMVKPALAYLDIIRAVSENTLLPVACYNVSGEYTMVKMAAAANFIEEQKIVMENMHAFARAGARIIISYHTKDIFEKSWL
jgi:porphobilinogen synthase